MKKIFLCTLFFSFMTFSFADNSYEYSVKRGVETSSGSWDVSTCTSTRGSSCSTPGASFRTEHHPTLGERIEKAVDYIASFF